MKKFRIEIQETLSKIVEIEAENIEKAIEKASISYEKEDIILDSEDYIDTTINELK